MPTSPRSDLTRRTFVGGLMLAASGLAAATPAEDATATLDQPFRFLVRLPGWTVSAYDHESDTFASWGTVVLTRQGAATSSPAANLRQAVNAAHRASWRSGPASDSVDVLDRRAHGVAGSGVPATLRVTRGGGKHHDATRYVLVMWASDDATRLIAQVRVDAS